MTHFKLSEYEVTKIIIVSCIVIKSPLHWVLLVTIVLMVPKVSRSCELLLTPTAWLDVDGEEKEVEGIVTVVLLDEHRVALSSPVPPLGSCIIILDCMSLNIK